VQVGVFGNTSKQRLMEKFGFPRQKRQSNVMEAFPEMPVALSQTPMQTHSESMFVLSF